MGTESRASGCTGCQGKCNELSNCGSFLALSPRDRFEFAKRNHLCIKCLKGRPHSAKGCGARCTMADCGKPHHILLHFDEFKMKNYNQNKNDGKHDESMQRFTPVAESTPPDNMNLTSAGQDSESPTSALKVVEKENKSTHVLATAIIKIKSDNGEYLLARALIDSGAMVNFVTKRFAAMVRAKLIPKNTDMKGMFAAERLTHVAPLTLKSCHSEFTTAIEAVVLNKFEDCHPRGPLPLDMLKIPQNIAPGLADPQFYRPQAVDIILGVGIAYDILSVGQIKLDTGLTLQKTMLGWLAAGNINTKVMTGKPFANNSYVAASLTSSESDVLKLFWEMEEAKPPARLQSKEEKYCEQNFEKTVTRDKEGRFTVTLPFKLDPSVLGSSYSSAKSYLESIEAKLNRQPVLKQMYHDFLDEYESLGHMTEVKKEDLANIQTQLNYIPHHYVLKWDSSSTKLRVVFHASFPTSTGHSFNSIQCVGPTLQPNLFDILIRARMKPIMVCADITKMYRQIWVDPTQRRHQCILWRRPNGDLVTFKLNTITYGTASASFLAVRCLIELAKTHPEFKLAARAILTASYIDDVVTGAASVAEAKQLVYELIELFGKACLPLRKWCSNSKEVLELIPEDQREPLVTMGDESVTKTLGMQWNPETDAFMFHYKPDEGVKVWTKRKVISTVSRIFDPLGLVGPVIAKAKMFCQHLWKLGLKWDESLDQQTQTKWIKFLEDMKTIDELRFPRFVAADKPIVRTELHCFADASTKGYGTVFYVKYYFADKTHKVSLLCSKSRVAPVKTISLPRLELCGALLLADLYDTVSKALDQEFDDVYCWLDSKLALIWITSSPHRWNDFVAVRATKANVQVPRGKWRFIPGHLNPADKISRGETPSELLNDDVWQNGPEFLQLDEEYWTFEPINESEFSDEALEAKNQTFTFLAQVDDNISTQLSPISKKYLSKLRRVTGYVDRFIRNCRDKRRTKNQILTNVIPKPVPLTAIELHNGLKIMIKVAQMQYFGEQRERLLKNKNLKSTDPIIKLSPFVDSEGFIRVGGRLAHANYLSFEEKHPILLPKSHWITRLIVKYLHWLNLHAGPQALLAIVRSKYWPLSGRVIATQVFRSCKTCFLNKPVVYKQIMGELPTDRVNFERPFDVTGVDLFGPFLVTNPGRGSRRTEMYAVIFICFATKAVYITYVEDQTTASFLNALQRFVARRGCPSHIWSDNARNFTGANEVMKHINWERVDLWCREMKSIQMHTVPPRSPHFGGFWESSVKLAKKSLLKVLKDKPIHFDAFNTLLAVVEGVVNSRPITPISANPNDEPPLTPAHFLTGTPMTTLPEPNVIDLPSRKYNLVEKWQRLNEIKSHWQKRWCTEVLRSYQVRGKWYVGSAEVKVGALVLTIDPGTTENSWLVATIKELHPGADNKVRVATVVTSTGSEFKRAIVQLAPIPTDKDDNEESDG